MPWDLSIPEILPLKYKISCELSRGLNLQDPLTCMLLASLYGASTICSNPGSLQTVLPAICLGTNHHLSNLINITIQSWPPVGVICFIQGRYCVATAYIVRLKVICQLSVISEATPTIPRPSRPWHLTPRRSAVTRALVRTRICTSGMGCTSAKTADMS